MPKNKATRNLDISDSLLSDIKGGRCKAVFLFNPSNDSPLDVGDTILFKTCEPAHSINLYPLYVESVSCRVTYKWDHKIQTNSGVQNFSNLSFELV